ncbi:MAG: LIC20035 family adhesin, partial [Leptospiraceae bacterium]|nr:LIC20035 family adhesin [Leptospiraceae bacterium]
EKLGKKSEFEFESPNIRIERYPETFLLKAKGAIDCASSPCSNEETEPNRLKTLPKKGLWEEYTQKEKLGTKEKYTVKDRAGEYVSGKRNGIWKFFYETGEVIRETTYVSGKKEGLEKKFKQDGTVLEEINYKDDLMDGPYWKKNRNGLLEKEGQYSKDKKTGLWREYYAENADKVLKSVTIYVEDKKHGEEIRYYEDGKTVMSQGNFVDGLESGNWKYFYDNGSLESEGAFKPVESKIEDESDKDKPSDVKPKARKSGPWKKFYKNGNKFSEGMREGGCVGEWKFYHKTGKLAAKGNMSNDLMMQEGEWYDEDGLLAGKGKFMISIINIDTKKDEIKRTYRPSKPFTIFKKGLKYLEITNVEKEGATVAYMFDDSGTKKIGEGPIEPNTQKLNGCWQISGKNVYYLMGTVKEGALARMQKCE